jgi:hypothetical protein
MGLDMYLSASRYVGGWKHQTEEERDAYRQTMLASGFGDFRCDESPSISVAVTVAYWRKANAIHKWFVDNCQGGEDNCQRSYVDRGKLQELITLCKQVLDTVETVPGDLDDGRTYHSDGTVEQHTKPGQVVAQPSVAAKVLPTASGFFFGSTDYDEYYLEDLRDTIKQIEPLLTDERFAGCDFYYRASW